jgi:hypothetical protein
MPLGMATVFWAQLENQLALDGHEALILEFLPDGRAFPRRRRTLGDFQA